MQYHWDETEKIEKANQFAQQWLDKNQSITYRSQVMLSHREHLPFSPSLRDCLARAVQQLPVLRRPVRPVWDDLPPSSPDAPWLYIAGGVLPLAAGAALLLLCLKKKRGTL